MTNQLTEQPWPWSQRGGMVKANAAARRASIMPNTFIRACERGEIPVKLERIGRFHMVRAEELEAWLAPHSASVRLIRAEAEDLFQGTA